MRFQSPTIEALKSDTPEGCCIMCGDPLTGRRKVICPSNECLNSHRRVYNSDYMAAYRSSKRMIAVEEVLDRPNQWLARLQLVCGCIVTKSLSRAVVRSGFQPVRAICPVHSVKPVRRRPEDMRGYAQTTQQG